MSGVAGGVDAGAGGVSPALSFCLRKSLEQDKGPFCGGHGAESGPLGARSVQYGKSVGYQGSTQAGGRICQYPVSAVGRLYGFSDNWAVGGQIFCCQETTHILYYLRLQVGEAAGGERFGAFLAKGLQGLRQPTDMDLLSTTEKITPGSENITGGCMTSENLFQDVMEILLLLYQRDTCIRRPYGRSDHFRKLSLIHISEPTRLRRISYAVFCLKKKKKKKKKQ